MTENTTNQSAQAWSWQSFDASRHVGQPVADPLEEFKKSFATEVEQARKAGYEAARAEMQQQLNQLQQQLSELDQIRVNYQTLEANLHSSFWAISETLIPALAAHVISEEQSLAHDVVKSTLEKIQHYISENDVSKNHDAGIEVRVHPTVVNVASGTSEKISGFSALNIIWKADPTLTLGDVIVDTKVGGLNFSLENQFKSLLKTVKQSNNTNSNTQVGA